MKNQIVLRNAMTAKAAFYAITCIFICLFSQNFAEFFGTTGTNLIFGFGLVLFNLAALSSIALLKGKIDVTAAKALTAVDIMIVSTLFGSMALQLVPFNANGYMLTGMTAAIIACLAYSQHCGIVYQLERTMLQYAELEVVKSDAA